MIWSNWLSGNISRINTRIANFS